MGSVNRVSIETYYRKSKSLYSETITLGEKLILKKPVQPQADSVCLPVFQTAAQLFPWTLCFTKSSEAGHKQAVTGKAGMEQNLKD